ncbi:hypothetical protein BHU72_03765 [Desulfuribacillus stibiiarsenatis]|uniref:Holin n=1 Tax=Desulfuribacillus stibiiarsenatis TaxID=1390249 RepID=A0A1E5L6W9_9FIRM|nr:hypothetical protein [Desulfuribacillus stibiiarsenatis]OEH85900.1 hypothetical protein BHU72_03765 [Desulfuribacillus stibiiarsenatis]
MDAGHTIDIVNSQSVTFIAIVSALVQLSKRYINPYYAPLVSIVFGLLISIGFYYSGIDTSDNWFIAIVRGIIIGLSASGLYSNINMTQKRTKKT